MDLKTVIHLGRFRQIVFTLLKYGFGDLVERLDLPGKVLIEKIQNIDPNLTTYERVRLALEELGPTFVKIGQILSERPDIAPPGLVEELQKLQENVPPVEFSAIRKVVEEDFRCRLEDVFVEFDREPQAAASLAQVHRAMLKEERWVVAVKVQRPNIRNLIDTDVHILEAIARRLDERMEGARVYNLPKLVGELERSLRKELDFTREVRNMKIFQSHFAGNDEIYIPRVFEDYCTEQVLTMELVTGTKLKDFALRPAEERELLAKRGVRITIKQILEDGFFHADPHPGNVLILDNLAYCLLDFGMVGRLAQDTRFDLIDMIRAMVDKDSETMLDSLLRISHDGSRSSLNERRIEREIMDIVEVYHSMPIQKLNIGRLLMELIGILRENGLQVPVDLTLMIKALATVEGTARMLYPDLNLVEEAKPYVRRLSKERWTPQLLWRTLRRNFFYLFELQKEFPQKVNHIIDLVERGELNIRFHHMNLGGLLKTLETITNRLTSSIIVAAMVIGSSMMVSSNIGGLVTLGVVGYIFSGIVGAWLLFNILRSPKD